jgi:hypothetical protein
MFIRDTDVHRHTQTRMRFMFIRDTDVHRHTQTRIRPASEERASKRERPEVPAFLFMTDRTVSPG